MGAGNLPSRPVEVIRAGVIDAGIGNIDSVASALRYLGLDFGLVSTGADLAGMTHIILPGVGAFRAGMAALEAHGLVAPIRAAAASGDLHILGICLGMQLLGEYSDEGDCTGLGIIPFDVHRIPQTTSDGGGIKVPHVGFSTVTGYREAGLFAGLGESADFYFTHSFAVRTMRCAANTARVHYGTDLIAAFEAGLICGAQFHPEKSQANGLQLFRNFFEL